MDALDLARWQFAITTLYHFLFVPVTLGLSWVVAILHTAYFRTGKGVWKAQAQFWGKLFLINVAMGVVTGIVQEFQFGMNWSTYSRYVGDIFGAPLAMEGLIAFFLESTFLGVWIFGWGRLKPKVHLATIYLTALGTCLSAAFILGANAWMQHPVGYKVNPLTHRAELTDIWAVLTNPWLLISYVHTIVAALLLAGVCLVAVSSWYFRRQRYSDTFRPMLRTGLVLSLVAAGGVAFSGHIQAQIMTTQQPMKIAAAEALWQTSAPASFSLFAIGNLGQKKNVVDIAVPHLLSVLATNTWNGKVQGINNLQTEYQQKYGPGDYIPNVAITYWTFRIMTGIAFLLGLIALVGLWLWRRGVLEHTRWFLRIGVVSLVLPVLANLSGWMFTEMGRQPWVVFGLLRTRDAVSPSVGLGSVLLTLIGFTVVYGALAVITVMLMAAVIRTGPDEEVAEEVDQAGAVDLSMATAY